MKPDLRTVPTVKVPHQVPTPALQAPLGTLQQLQLLTQQDQLHPVTHVRSLPKKKPPQPEGNRESQRRYTIIQHSFQLKVKK
ncbi:hypothetical protein AVEN_8662-1 [Araneus ventricosus]|uniref:Uncharacterized protein n=1 Tax=Araneus ventricosus TaxID=182803 RepID=A0A4Y2C2Y4_ARAVE|nr:hypothetical protein AVEN_8662-1 [Araneus ventricosus]